MKVTPIEEMTSMSTRAVRELLRMLRKPKNKGEKCRTSKERKAKDIA